MWDDQETEFLSDDYALTTTTAEAEQVPPSDDYILIANEDDRKASHLCIWLVNYLTHLQFHLPDGAMQSILKCFQLSLLFYQKYLLYVPLLQLNF